MYPERRFGQSDRGLQTTSRLVDLGFGSWEGGLVPALT